MAPPLSRQVARLAGVGLLSLAFTLAAFGDGIEIVGRVLDPQGRSVRGATVRLQAGTFNAAVVTTDKQGSYRISSVSAGVYRLTAEAAGFQDTCNPGVSVHCGCGLDVPAAREMKNPPPERPI